MRRGSVLQRSVHVILRGSACSHLDHAPCLDMPTLFLQRSSSTSARISSSRLGSLSAGTVVVWLGKAAQACPPHHHGSDQGFMSQSCLRSTDSFLGSALLNWDTGSAGVTSALQGPSSWYLEVSLRVVLRCWLISSTGQARWPLHF